MIKQERLYRRTEAGTRACLRQDPALSEDHHRILGQIDGEMHWDVIRTLLRRHADFAVLADLEARRLISSVAAAPAYDLDFTGSFTFAKQA
jgi:hypothetical protein